MKNSRLLEDANSDSVEKFLNELGPKPYSHEDLKRFTANFSKSNKVGSGGYGKVYKGQFYDGLQVAVKVLAKKDVIEETFMAEVSTMGKAYHRNLVKLYGYCFEPNMKALVYEYMENGSLDKILYGNHLAGIEWEKLYDISIETAKGLVYLHDGWDERIIHYDIKASNVLLDKNLSPKITDFGLAKLMKRDVSRVPLSRIRGTVGYNAPETWMPGSHVTYKCDVYSFGMMLFEVLGKRSNGECENWFPVQVWKKFENGQLEQIIQDCGITEKDKEKAKTLSLVALWCAQYTPEIRPSMLDVVLMLEKKIAVRTPPYPFQFMQPSMFSMLPSKEEVNPEVYSEGYESLPKKSTPGNSSTAPPKKPTEFLETPRNDDSRESELSLQLLANKRPTGGYVLEKMDPGLWKIVLSPENEYRRELIDQVITVLPECKSPEQVSAAVKAFMTADLPHELIEILEKLVLYNSAFSSNFNLQNLLILSAIKADASRVMNYIHKLDNLDGPAVGEVAVEAELYEEAFFIFKKFNLNVQAVNVLLDNIQNIERAVEFAFNVDEDAVWSQVAKGQVKLSGYVLERMDPGLWKIVLSPENEYRRELIDQVITALPECKSPEQVSAAVKAFMTADLPHELIEILEKLVLYNSAFSSNFNLQNLLILSAIKADASRVMNYIHKLDNFDGPAIGEVAVEAELYEEAFFIFKIFKMNVQAVSVLLDNIQNIERAVEFAFNVDEDGVWSQVAKGQVKLSKMA